MTTETYRPSNGTECEWFYSKWCANCERDRYESRPCSILGRTFALDADDPKYPREWIEDEAGPRCTAFRQRAPGAAKHRATTIRDKRQMGLLA